MSRRVKALLGYAVAVAASLGVFALYTRPDMMVAVSDMLWACFN